MNVYWGYGNSGKLHIEIYAKYNGMTLLSSKYNNFMKLSNKIHCRGVTRKGNYWMFCDTIKKVYCRDKDKFISSKTTDTNSMKRFHFVPDDSYINPLSKAYRDFMNGLKQTQSITVNYNASQTFSDEDIKKYTGIEYKGSELYNTAMMQFIINKEFEDLGYDMLNDNTDEIFDDVDLVMISTIDKFYNSNPYGNEDGVGFLENNYLLQKTESKKYTIPENVLNKLRKANNIIPYKSDLFSWAIGFIDSFSHLSDHIYDEEQGILEKDLYDKNKKIIFQFLDHQFYIPSKIAEFLTKRNIPYRYFDLDNDWYNEVFGGTFEIDRDYTSHASSWKDYQDRYNQVADIAKEYISLRNVTTMKL